MDEAYLRGLLIDAGAPVEWHDDMIAIAYCESRFRPDALGDGGNSRGLYQLWTGWFPHAGEDLSMWADPATNTRVAVHVRTVRGRFGGPGGWTCSDKLGIE